MPVGIGIGEESSLKHFVKTGLHAGDEVAWGEGALLGFGKVVVNISVDDHSSNGNEGIVTMGDDLGDIKNVPFVTVAVNFWNDLDEEVPFCCFS